MWLSALRLPVQLCDASARQVEAVPHQGQETLLVRIVAIPLAEELHVRHERHPAVAAMVPLNQTCAQQAQLSVPSAATAEKTLCAYRQAPKKEVELPCETGAVDLLGEQLPHWRTILAEQHQLPKDRLQESPCVVVGP